MEQHDRIIELLERIEQNQEKALAIPLIVVLLLLLGYLLIKWRVL